MGVIATESKTKANRSSLYFNGCTYLQRSRLFLIWYLSSGLDILTNV